MKLPQSMKSGRGRSHGEKGMAMLAVLMCCVVVISLSAVALEQSLGSIQATAQGRQQVQTVDAAESGIQAEVNQLESVYGDASGTVIPCKNGQVTITQSGASNVADASSIEYYTLSMVTGTTSSLSNPQPCSSNSFTVPGNADPWYALVQSQATNSAGTASGRTLQALVQLNDNATAPVGSTTTTTAPVTTYNSNSFAQDLNINLGTGYDITKGVDSGTKATSANPNPANGNLLTVTAPTYLTLSAGSEVAQVSTSNGSSYACAALLSAGGSLTGGSPTTACSTSGNATGGVTLNLLGLPGVSSALSGIVFGVLTKTGLISGLQLNFDAVSSWAADNGTGTILTGSAQLVNATFSLGLLDGLGTVSGSLNLPATLPSDANLIPYLATAITSNLTGLQETLLSALGLGGLGTIIGTDLASVLAIDGNYQTTSGGVLTASALHIGVLNSLLTANLAESQAGPNSASTPSTTTTLGSTPTTTLPPKGVKVAYIKQVS